MGQALTTPQGEVASSAPRNRTPQEIEELLNYEESRISKLRIAADELARGDTTALSLARHGISVLPNHLSRSLTSLDLSYNRLSSLPPEIAQLTGLQDLRVRCNHLQSNAKWSSVLSSLQQLVHLDLSWNFLDGANGLVALTKLTYLSLLHNRSIGLLPDLSPLVQLRYLSLAEVVPLRQLPAGLWSLSNLTELHLSSIQVENKTMPDNAFEAMRNLRILSLSYGGWPHLPSSIGSCEMLEYAALHGNLFTDLPESISRLTRLTCLNVGLNKFSAFPDVITSLTTLTELHINGTDLKKMPDDIGRLSALRKFTLRFNAFTALPTSLSQLTSLVTLELCGCSIATWPACFSTLTALSVLNLKQNPTTAADGVTPLPALRRFAGNEALGRVLMPTTIPVQPRNNWPIPPCPSTPQPLTGTTLSCEQLRDKIYGLIFGHALGDAIGLSSEFMSAPQASFNCGLEISFDEMLRDRHRGRWIPGDWTDDTDQMLLILENLLENKGTPDPRAFGRSLLQWAHRGMPEFGDAGGMGIGDTVSKVLMHPLFWDDPHAAAQQVWIARNRNAAANGGVMRTAVLGVPFFIDINTVIKNTDSVCQVTHHDPRCRASCVAVTVAVALLLQGKTNIEEITAQALSEGKRFADTYADELATHMNATLAGLELGERSTIGYTYKCCGSGFWALRQRDFAAALCDITLEAGDADTNGAVAGALLGCHLGFRALPQQWLDGLVHGEWLKLKAEQLCRLVGV